MLNKLGLSQMVDNSKNYVKENNLRKNILLLCEPFCNWSDWVVDYQIQYPRDD